MKIYKNGNIVDCYFLALRVWDKTVLNWKWQELFFSVVFLPLFIVQQDIFFSLRLCHHTSVHDIRTDGHLFFTLYLQE